MSSLWNSERVKRYLKMYGEPREKTGSQSQLCRAAASFLVGYNVADFGSGIGHIIPYIGKRQYLGIDSSVEMLKAAMIRFPLRKFIEGDARTIDLGQTFTSTVAISLLLHLEREEALKVLGNMWKHTASGGGVMVFGMETLGDGEKRRSSGLLIRNQSVNSILSDLEVATGMQIGERVSWMHQRIQYQASFEVTFFQEQSMNFLSCSPFAKTTLFKVGPKP